MLLENEVIGCENCKKCSARCKLLPDLDVMLYDHKTDYTKQWEFMKKGVENCACCGQCDDSCPAPFNMKYRVDGGADKCPRFEMEDDDMQVLENIEKGMEMLQDIIGTKDGVIPY